GRRRQERMSDQRHHEEQRRDVGGRAAGRLNGRRRRARLEYMTHSHNSPRRNCGLVYARTRDGVELPVIDVTNPRFAVPDDPAAAQRANEAFIAEERRRGRIPNFIVRLIMRAAARKSRLIRAIFASDCGYLDSITTYVLKLGADNLVPPYDAPLDRKVASS